MTWLLESPWPAIIGGAIAEVALVSVFFSTGRVRVLGWMAMAAALAGALVLVERLVVTDREQITADIHAAAAAVERGDADRVLGFISESADALRLKARTVVALRPREVRVSDIKIELKDDVDPPQAQVVCLVMVSHATFRGSLPVTVTAYLRKHEGEWLVYKADERVGL